MSDSERARLLRAAVGFLALEPRAPELLPSTLDEGPLAPPVIPAQPTDDDWKRVAALRRGHQRGRNLEACRPVE